MTQAIQYRRNSDGQLVFISNDDNLKPFLYLLAEIAEGDRTSDIVKISAYSKDSVSFDFWGCEALSGALQKESKLVGIMRDAEDAFGYYVDREKAESVLRSMYSDDFYDLISEAINSIPVCVATPAYEIILDESFLTSAHVL